jgi:hypothetical protein
LTSKPSAWTKPPNSIDIVIRPSDHDEQGLTPADKAADWTGLTEPQARLMSKLIGMALAKYLPKDVDWSIAALIFTSRPGDPNQAVDMVSASTVPWDAVAAIEEWLDNYQEDDA